MAARARKAVLVAILANVAMMVLKFISAIVTNSTSMMNEAIHSLMDTLNQMFLWVGLTTSQKPADMAHPFGHGQKKYIWNLFSAIGLFSIGAGLGMANAWYAWQERHVWEPPSMIEVGSLEFSSLWLALGVLGTGFILEGYSLSVALRQFFRDMKRLGYRNPFRYMTETQDSTLLAIVMEDSVAVLAVTLAGLGIGISFWTQDSTWDVIFSALIALLLGVSAFFLGRVNMHFLTAVRDESAEAVFEEVARDHPEVERYHDLRSIIVDDSHTVLVAEVELREEAMIPQLRKQIAAYEQELIELLPEDKRENPCFSEYCKTRAAAQATLERTETIVEELVATLKRRAPQIQHATIEVEGIATPPDTITEALVEDNPS